MSDFDVYNGEMQDRVLSERDIELLLSGASPEQESLARFATTLRSIHDTGAFTPSEEAVNAFASEAAQIAVAAQKEATASRSSHRSRNRGVSFGLKKKLAGGLAAAVLLSGMTGAAVAADGAAPGDPLYGLDRAVEAIGIGDGGPPERIAEAQALFNDGRTGEAIAHAAEAVETTDSSPEIFSPEDSKAAEALKGAAERIGTDVEDGADQDLNDAVAGVLSEIASMLESNDLDPADFGTRISELARSIGRSNGEAGNEAVPSGQPEPPDSGNSGPLSDAPTGPPDGVPAGPRTDGPGGTPSGPPAGGPGRP